MMCDIWKEKPKQDFDIQFFREVTGSQIFQNINSVSLTGGEPFLIPNLADFLALVQKTAPYAHINISTNGYRPDIILRTLQNAKNSPVSLTVSFDGPNNHDRIRGRQGSCAEIIKLVSLLKMRFPSIRVMLKFTITPWNYDEIVSTSRFAKQIGFPLQIKMIEYHPHYHNRLKHINVDKMFSKRQKSEIAAQCVRAIGLGVANKKNVKSLAKKLMTGKRDSGCPSKAIFFALNGYVYLCRKKTPIGNLKDCSITQVLHSEKYWKTKLDRDRCTEQHCTPFDFR